MLKKIPHAKVRMLCFRLTMIWWPVNSRSRSIFPGARVIKPSSCSCEFWNPQRPTSIEACDKCRLLLIIYPEINDNNIFSFDFDHQAQLEYLVQLMVDLNPTDEELSYMLCHICFEHIKKSCDRFTQETVEQLQDTLSDHLHDYYINHENRPTYSGRIVSMIKLNNAFQVFCSMNSKINLFLKFQKYVQRERLKCELMRLFKVLFVEYSNPELFVDYW